MSWFENITGISENEFKNNINKYIINNKIINQKTLKAWNTGTLINDKTIKELKNDIIKEQNLNDENFDLNDENIKFEIITGLSADVRALQRKIPNSVFLVASNFDGLEHPNENSKIEDFNFITNYCRDFTQGPSAALCAPACTIYRSCYSLLYNKNINSLKNVNQFYNISNGYSDLSNVSTNLLKSSNLGKELSLNKYIPIIHSNVEIVDNWDDLNVVNTIDQVYGAALNLKQRKQGKGNKEIVNEYPILQVYPIYCSIYSTYLAAVMNGRENIVLTLLGGGVFGNSLEVIISSIVSVHKKFEMYKKIKGFKENQNLDIPIKNVKLALFKNSKKDVDTIINTLKAEGIL